MPGKNDPDNRRCMPWEKIDAGQFGDVKQLIAFRRDCYQMKTNKIIWKHNNESPRCIHYQKPDEKTGNILEVYLNASGEDVMIQDNGNIVYSRNYSNWCLGQNGILISTGNGENSHFCMDI